MVIQLLISRLLMLFVYVVQHIVGLSAHANGKDAELGLKAGMNRFMSKPIPLQTLKDLASV